MSFFHPISITFIRFLISLVFSSSSSLISILFLPFLIWLLPFHNPFSHHLSMSFPRHLSFLLFLPFLNSLLNCFYSHFFLLFRFPLHLFLILFRFSSLTVIRFLSPSTTLFYLCQSMFFLFYFSPTISIPFTSIHSPITTPFFDFLYDSYPSITLFFIIFFINVFSSSFSLLLQIPFYLFPLLFWFSFLIPHNRIVTLSITLLFLPFNTFFYPCTNPAGPLTLFLSRLSQNARLKVSLDNPSSFPPRFFHILPQQSSHSSLV